MASVYKFSVLFFVFSIIVFGNSTIVTQIAKVLLALSFVLSLFDNNAMKVRNKGYYVLWNFLFALICVASVYWSIDKDATAADSRTVALCSICNIAVFYYLTRYRWRDTSLFRFICLSSLCSLGYFLVTNGTAVFYERTEASRNLNDIGMMFSTSIVLCLYLLNKKQHGGNRIFLFLMIIIFGLFVIMSGSKKALFLPIFSIGLNWVLKNSGRKRTAAIIGSGILAILSFYLVMNVPFLYDFIGVRIEGMINGFTGDTLDADDSTRTRMEMIKFAMLYFAQNPYLGIGSGAIDNIIGTYAHNNYVELLSCVGLIGTTIFYSLYIYLICYLYKVVKKTKNIELALCLSIVICYMFLHYGMVAYYDYFNSLMITISAACLCNWNNGVRNYE